METFYPLCHPGLHGGPWRRFFPATGKSAYRALYTTAVSVTAHLFSIFSIHRLVARPHILTPLANPLLGSNGPFDRMNASVDVEL